LKLSTRIVAALCGVALPAAIAAADPRPFTFVYDTYAVGQGNFEYEQWVTYSHHTDAEPGFDRVDVRHELEYGVADNFDLSLYFADWRYEDSEERTGMKYDGTAVEGILYLSNPVTDFIGSGLYAEFAIGEHELEFEQKLLLQKNVGDWVFAYNLILETEIEGVGDDEDGGENEIEGVLGHSLGASYAVGRDWRIGAEALVESVYEDWSDHEETSVYAGPNVFWQPTANLWVTLTPLFQLTDEEGVADYNVRLIAGYEF
jgi:hypothetical protein